MRFDNENSLLTMSAAINETMYIVGVRKFKLRDSDPAQYMSNLTSECGGGDGGQHILASPGEERFELSWSRTARTAYVRKVHSESVSS